MADTIQKQIFMEKIKRILNAKKKTIEIVHDQKMMNLKLIEKSARTKKDPSPLTSAMSTMGLKYPISVDTTKATKYKIPPEFLCKEEDSEDRHIHGRTLCKKEAIDWWVENSDIPTDNVMQVINILYKSARAETKKYYDINWEEARIRFGVPLLERKQVKTKETSFNIPAYIRKSLLKETLFPDYTQPDMRITPNMRSEIKEILEEE
ncbi:hypothetical protein JTB14_019744 [Gonioctena quinquepunctata]|nr:hypothetical protein JTB14_019744 [Gonioctena quinquepunctata]